MCKAAGECGGCDLCKQCGLSPLTPAPGVPSALVGTWNMTVGAGDPFNTCSIAQHGYQNFYLTFDKSGLGTYTFPPGCLHFNCEGGGGCTCKTPRSDGTGHLSGCTSTSFGAEDDCSAFIKCDLEEVGSDGSQLKYDSAKFILAQTPGGPCTLYSGMLSRLDQGTYPADCQINGEGQNKFPPDTTFICQDHQCAPGPGGLPIEQCRANCPLADRNASRDAMYTAR